MSANALPEPTVRPTRYEVSCLPPGDVNFKSFVVIVEQRDRYGWTVHDGFACLDADGTWCEGGTSVYGRDDAWINRHRFDEQTALSLAVDAAPHMKTFHGHTVADALRAARHEATERSGVR